MKKTLIFLLGILLLASCGKDKKAAEAIEGTWLETKIDGVAVALEYADKITFGPCKNKKKENCDCIIEDGSSAITEEYTYYIDNKGEALVFKAGFFTVTYTIVELEGSKLVINWGGYTGEYTKI